jgi:iron complex transport system ATP-binding protein
LLQADDVTLEYDGPTRDVAGELRPGLHGVSLSIPRGALFGILGPNGSGKTTLLRILAGILPPEKGNVRLDGADMRSLTRRAVARRLAVVPQETRLAFDYSVLEIVLMGRYPHLDSFGLEGPQDVRIAREALSATGTLEMERRPFSTLSGGEKQRVVIASALAQSPELMLLDEPTASLDLGYQMEIGSLLRRLNRDRGVTIVVATHDLGFAAAVCSRLMMLREGKVLATGPVEGVLTPQFIERLYGVRADVVRHQETGRLVVVPVGQAGSRKEEASSEK